MKEKLPSQQPDSQLQILLQGSYAVPFLRMTQDIAKLDDDKFLDEIGMLFFDVYNFRSINELVNELENRERDEYLLKQQWKNLKIEDQNQIKKIYQELRFIKLLGVLKYIISIGNDFSQLVFPFYPSASQNDLGERILWMINVVYNFFIGWNLYIKEKKSEDVHAENLIPKNVSSLLHFVDEKEQELIFSSVDEYYQDLKKNIPSVGVLIQQQAFLCQIVHKFIHQTLNDLEKRTAETCYRIIDKLSQLSEKDNDRRNRLNIFSEFFEKTHFLGIADLYPFSLTELPVWISQFMKTFLNTFDRAINLESDDDIILLLKNNKCQASVTDLSVEENLHTLWLNGTKLKQKLTDLRKDLYDFFCTRNSVLSVKEKEKENNLVEAMTKFYIDYYLFIYQNKLRVWSSANMVEYYNHHYLYLENRNVLDSSAFLSKIDKGHFEKRPELFHLSVNSFKNYALIKLGQDVLSTYDAKISEKKQNDTKKESTQSLSIVLKKTNQQSAAKKPVSKIKLILGGIVLLIGASLMTYLALQTAGIVPVILTGIALSLQWSIGGSVTFIGLSTMAWGVVPKLKAKLYQFIDELNKEPGSQPQQNAAQNNDKNKDAVQKLADSHLYSSGYPGENSPVLASSSSHQREFSEPSDKRSVGELNQAGIFKKNNQNRSRSQAEETPWCCLM